MPPKRDLRLIGEHFESESVDVSTVSSHDVKTVMTINQKSVFSTEEPKPVRKNSFGPPIIEDLHLDDDSEDEVSPTVEVKTVKPSVENIESVQTARKIVKIDESPKQHKHHPRRNQRNWNNLMKGLCLNCQKPDNINTRIEVSNKSRISKQFSQNNQALKLKISKIQSSGTFLAK
uniref:Uncharacterized protein n=1 Tax=Tanacetum cinerariifolium TaxID=118510 RepID=A0A6L2LEG6_TANCI|nr:hypothetical protein [Tanacetum cinerariifolium]GEX95931.1 hypothetical protein [Tanacetum cinerariifolium]